RAVQDEDGCLPSAVLSRVIAAASRDVREAQGVTEDVRAAASDLLVALARCHFDSVMCELQSHLRVLGGISEDFVFVTLGKLASSYALRCVPFIGMTLFTLRAMLSHVGSSQTLRAVCSVLEQWSKAANSYLSRWEKCPFPRVGEAQFCSSVYPLFCHVVRNWLDCEEEEVKQAVLGAMAAMMGLLLHEEEHRERVWEQLPWLLGQYQQVQDTSWVTKGLRYFLEILGEVKIPVPKAKVQAIGTAVHSQLSDETKQHSGEHRSELRSCVLLLARVSLEDTVTFLGSQLGSKSEAARVVSLDLLRALVRPAGQCRGAQRGRPGSGLPGWGQTRLRAMHKRPTRAAERVLPGRAAPRLRGRGSASPVAQCVCERSPWGTLPLPRPSRSRPWFLCRSCANEPGAGPAAEVGQSLAPLARAVQGVLRDPGREVARAVLRFTKELLGCSVQSCSAWELVAHVFARFSQASGRLAEGNLSEAEAQEEADLQALCLDILHSLDVSIKGMSKLLWPRLLQYVVPAQYTGTLVPLSRCLRELAERRESAEGEDGEEEPDAAAARDQARLPTPQALLARLLVSRALGKGSRGLEATGEVGAEPLREPGPAASGQEGACESESEPPLPRGDPAAVVAAAPHAGGGCGIAALRLLQALSTEIHGAVGMVWAVKIPFLLEHLAERSESSLDSAEWEHLLLKFLRTSLETIESQAWTMAFSFELNQQAGSYCRLSREQAFLYKAVGVSLAACQHVPYVRGEIRKYLFQTNYLEASEREAMISVVAGSAESHFPLALEVVHEFGATMEERPVSGAFRRLKEYHQGKRAGTHTALVLAYGRMALCAPREQLLARVESDVVGPILRHYRASCQVLGFTFSTKVSAAQRGLASCPSRTPSLLRACRTGAPQATGPGSSGGRCRESSCRPRGSCFPGGERRFPSSGPCAELRSLRHPGAVVAPVCRALGLGSAPHRSFGPWRCEEPVIGAAVFLSAGMQDVQLKLALVRSIAEVSRAMQGAGGSQRAELCCKRELLSVLLGFVRAEPRDCLASPVRQEAFLAVGHLSKLKPSLSREESRDLLDQCLQSVMPLPALEPAEEEGATAAGALHLRALHAQTMGALGELVTALLEEDLTSSWLVEMLHVLEYWLSSAREWERERALQACAQLLGAYEERFELTGENSFGLFGSTVGLLAPFVCDSLATSRQRAGACLGHLLRIQGKALETTAEEDEVQSLCQRLRAPDAEALLQASSRLSKIVCKYIPPAQAADFVSAALDGMLSARAACAQAAGEWLLAFLETCGGQLLMQVPEILSIIYIRMPTMQQDTLRGLLFKAVSLLAHYHPGAVIDSLLHKQLPMDSETVELWGVLGRTFVAGQLLGVLMEKLKDSGSDRPGTSSAEPEADDSQAALEPLKITCAIFEVVSTLQSPEAVQHLLPELLPVLLQQISATLGKEMPFSKVSGRGKLFLKGHMSDDNPCRLSLETLEAVLRACLHGGWLWLLRKQGAWAALEDPRAHHDGVCLLTGVLLRAGVVSLPVVLVVTQWLDSPSANRRVMAAAFCAELMKAPVPWERRCLQPIVGALLQKSRDPSRTVRQMAARGLGNLARGAPETLREHRGAVVAALRSGLESGGGGGGREPAGAGQGGGGAAGEGPGRLLQRPRQGRSGLLQRRGGGAACGSLHPVRGAGGLRLEAVEAVLGRGAGEHVGQPGAAPRGPGPRRLQGVPGHAAAVRAAPGAAMAAAEHRRGRRAERGRAAGRHLRAAGLGEPRAAAGAVRRRPTLLPAGLRGGADHWPPGGWGPRGARRHRVADGGGGDAARGSAAGAEARRGPEGAAGGRSAAAGHGPGPAAAAALK
ncbi:LOW QUALITY PROTEIN: maestro heat-like repeat-containing protein family member 2B, partial [Rhea pennata]|uniref:LOW QUALITY PROTEIN: maestro heat-like repeat-containing protein family member 2B n=1 Tax=Rhea pennata TaxID=8795 RepID=UPI002E25985C